MAGFTLLELIIVVAIIALASAVATLALRDPAATRLEREGQRLVMLLESGRAQSRSLGVPITWTPASQTAPTGADGTGSADFRFIGAPDAGRGSALPTRFLEPQTDDARVIIELTSRQTGVVLGPEPLIGAQRIVLRLNNHRVILATDGLGPFVAVDE